MYSGGSCRELPGAREEGPVPDRLKVRRNCSFRLSSRFCTSMLPSCSSNDKSTTPPCPSPSPGAGRCLWRALEMGLLSPQRGPWSSRTEYIKSKVLEVQMVPSWETQVLAMEEIIWCTLVYAPLGLSLDELMQKKKEKKFLISNSKVNFG